jgi:hypothetical protein
MLTETCKNENPRNIVGNDKLRALLATTKHVGLLIVAAGFDFYRGLLLSGIER